MQLYVQKLSVKTTYERLLPQGGVAIASLDSNAGRLLAAQVNDPGFLAKVEKQLCPLRRQLGIAEGSDWSADSAEYKVGGSSAGARQQFSMGTGLPAACIGSVLLGRQQAGTGNGVRMQQSTQAVTGKQLPPYPSLASTLLCLSTQAAAGLRETMLRNTESRVERNVAFLAALQADRSAEAHSGHASALIRSRVQYRIKSIRELMAVWESWQRFCQPPGFEPPQWDEADAFSNVLPWTVASPAHGMTEQHIRYKVYCAAQELRRCEEELRFLPQDAVNTLQYFEWQQQQLAAAIEALDPCSAAGRVHMLSAWRARIAHMQRIALAAFVKAGWLECT